jgi:hypothetical protein
VPEAWALRVYQIVRGAATVPLPPKGNDSSDDDLGKKRGLNHIRDGAEESKKAVSSSSGSEYDTDQDAALPSFDDQAESGASTWASAGRAAVRPRPTAGLTQPRSVGGSGLLKPSPAKDGKAALEMGFNPLKGTMKQSRGRPAGGAGTLEPSLKSLSTVNLTDTAGVSASSIVSNPLHSLADSKQ